MDVEAFKETSSFISFSVSHDYTFANDWAYLFENLSDDVRYESHTDYYSHRCFNDWISSIHVLEGIRSNTRCLVMLEYIIKKLESRKPFEEPYELLELHGHLRT